MSKNLESKFIHLRAHSDYSLGRSTNKIPPLIQEALKYKMPALCLSDQGNLFGSLEFSLECVKYGIKPLIGCLIKVSLPAQFSQSRIGKPTLYDFFLIAKNEVGYQNLLCLVSNSFLEHGPNKNPHITLETLLAASEGLVLLCSATGSIIQNLFSLGKLQEAEDLLQLLRDKFQNDLFLEFVRVKEEREEVLESFSLDLAYKFNIPIVATNPIAYLTPDMREAQDILLCITEGKYVLEDERLKAAHDHYFKSPKEMVDLFADLPEAIENTALIAMKCSVMAESRPPLLPRFTNSSDSDSTDSVSEAEILYQEATFGLEKKLQDLTESSERKKYFDRLKFEVDVINKMNFPGYFLIVSDFIKWSKNQNIPVGPGRGSGAGSIVAWALDITDLDPIKFGLLFERFLNPDRVSMPDFDIDFCQERRDEVIEYVRNKYGHDRVAQIITFGKLQARAVLRDVGRVLQLPYGLIDKISKSVPHNPANPITLADAIKLDKELQEQRRNEPDIDKLLTISLQLEGINRHVSTHAAGIVIADRPIVELAPLYFDSNSMMPAVQYSLKYAEAAGLTKFDFLGLKTLTVLSKTCQLINTNTNFSAHFDLNLVDLSDKKTYEMLSKGEATGVFQFEGAGMRGSIKNLKPDSINDLIALASLYRPGPMDNIPSYIKRKHGLEKVTYIHPKLEHALKETYGIIIYQEQVMEIARILAGYSLGEADLLRRAMGKKNKAEMELLKSGFIKGAVINGIQEEQAQEIFALIEKFASYGFNKSHAAAYSMISYHTAYLKAHYPLEFFTASINLEINDSDKINLFCTDARHFGIKILPPDINFSKAYFSIEGDAIRFGLAGVKNVGVAAMEALVQIREKNGKFVDIFDLFARCSNEILNKRAIENLAKASGFTSIISNQKKIFLNTEILLKYSHFCQNNSALQIDLFAEEKSGDSQKPELQETDEWGSREKLDMEFEALGFYLTSHPLAEYVVKLKKTSVVPSSKIESYAEKNSVKLKIAGVVINKKIRSTPRGRFAFLQISDQSGIIDASVFNEDMLYEHAQLITEGHAVFCEVDVRKDTSGIKIIIEKIYDLHEYMSQVKTVYRLYVKDTHIIDELTKHFSDHGTEIRITAVIGEANVYFATANPLYVQKSIIDMLKNMDGVSLLEL